jgi:hypothetical protein
MKKVSIVLILLLAISYSVFWTPQKIEYSFYYWQSTYQVKGDSSPRYVKVLDVDYRKTLNYKETAFTQIPKEAIVPTLYLDNFIWKKIKAKTMVKKVLNSLEKMPIHYDEIQVDCDWTESSRDSYFKFLKLLKEHSKKRLSATIRLHQVKYHEKTGIPPVDYGVLMYYNMSDFQDLETKNYILDLNVAKQYHYNFKSYSLPLNLALPIYSQATLIRFSKVVGLIDGIREKELTKNFQKIGKHLYQVTKTHYFKKKLFYKGDKLRVDEVSKELLQKSIAGLKKIMPKPKKIIFYRWANRTHYKKQTFDKIIASW